MRKLFLIGVLMLPTIASAEVVHVQTAKGHQCVGDKFPITKPIEVLYKDRKCDLPLVHAKDMRAYLFSDSGSASGNLKRPVLSLKGCWGTHLDGSYVIVRQDGSQSYAPPNAYVTANLSENGTATVTASPNQGSRYAQAMGMCP
ncbi:hypothetical protein ACA087_00810 [Pseudomonas chlororaphis]|uniref:hypothetical protein n=1 Tax=Pseudomonas chlororaphis TaxID=587753 RepID=UPI00352AAE99